MKQHNNNNIIIISMFVTNTNYGAHAPEKVVRK